MDVDLLISKAAYSSNVVSFGQTIIIKMKSLVSRTLILIGFFLFITAILILRPVPIVVEDKALVIKGVVLTVHEGGDKDVVIRLIGDSRIYYINRGLQYGLELDKLKKQLIGRKVVMKYPKYWTPLDWNDRIKHISKLEASGKVLFNELKN